MVHSRSACRSSAVLDWGLDAWPRMMDYVQGTDVSVAGGRAVLVEPPESESCGDRAVLRAVVASAARRRPRH